MNCWALWSPCLLLNQLDLLIYFRDALYTSKSAAVLKASTYKHQICLPVRSLVTKPWVHLCFVVCCSQRTLFALKCNLVANVDVRLLSFWLFNPLIITEVLARVVEAPLRLVALLCF